MLKKTLTTALLVCTIPAVASASWFLSTQARNAGGTIDTRNKAGQNVADGSIFKSYTTSADIPVTVAANAGYTIKSVTIGGVTTDAPASPFSTTIPGSYGDKSVSALFSVTGLTVTASNPGGTVSPAALGNVYYGYTLNNDVTFVFTPRAGYSISSISGIPAGASSNIPGGVNQRATVTIPAGTVFNSSVAMAAVAVNTTPSLTRIAPKVAASGELVSLVAASSNVASPSYTWTYVSGPANTVSYSTDANGKISTTVTPGPVLTLDTSIPGTVKFTAPTAVGQYKFRLTESTAGLNMIAAVNVVATAADSSTQCQFCHTANGIADPNLGANYRASIHGQSTHSACVSCHYEVGNASHPGSLTAKTVDASTFTVKDGLTVTGGYGRTVTGGQIFCTTCHQGGYAIPHATTGLPTTCNGCHTPTSTGDAHSIMEATCVGCHSVPRNAGAQFVQDNNGVRAVVGEFSKWSHHVSGVELNDAHCAACHLEGKVNAAGTKVEVDFSKHMSDNKVHLRDTTNGADDDFAWDPTAPDFGGMDNFCMGCHDSNGAVSPESANIQAFINANGIAAAGKTASATNPFGDTISNRYDKMERPAVVDAKGQFNINNPSHHAVLGQKYSGRTRAAGPRQIANAATFAQNSSAVLYGVRSTIYDSRVSGNSQFGAYNVSKFVETYETLSPAPGTADKTLGDDSVLHCADCHTVGQYSAISPIAKNNAVIGAHGSNNEYLLRNFAGTDERHVGQSYSVNASNENVFTDPAAPGRNATVLTSANKPWLVCFNCHSYQNYGSIGNATNLTGTNHAGEYANSTRCNGPVNTIPFAGYTTGTATDGEQYVTRLGEDFIEGPIYGSTSTADVDYSNIFGIQCMNCHNAGKDNAFGGIHGAKVQTYTDANGQTQKAYRFLPGLGNTMFVPGSKGAGIGSVSDLNWEQKALGTTYNAGKTAVVDNSGCYTLVPDTDAGLNLTTTASYSVSPTSGQKAYDATTNMFGTWGGCDDHRGNAHGKAFANTVAPFDGGTYNTGGAGAVRKVLRPVTY